MCHELDSRVPRGLHKRYDIVPLLIYSFSPLLTLLTIMTCWVTSADLEIMSPCNHWNAIGRHNPNLCMFICYSIALFFYILTCPFRRPSHCQCEPVIGGAAVRDPVMGTRGCGSDVGAFYLRSRVFSLCSAGGELPPRRCLPSTSLGLRVAVRPFADAHHVRCGRRI